MMLETAVVLAVPALFVVGIGVYIEASGSSILTWLAVAFVFSWAVVIYRVRSVSRLWQ